MLCVRLCCLLSFTSTTGLTLEFWGWSFLLAAGTWPLGIMMRYIPVTEDPKSFADYYGIGEKGGRMEDVVRVVHSETLACRMVRATQHYCSAFAPAGHCCDADADTRHGQPERRYRCRSCAPRGVGGAVVVKRPAMRMLKSQLFECTPPVVHVHCLSSACGWCAGPLMLLCFKLSEAVSVVLRCVISLAFSLIFWFQPRRRSGSARGRCKTPVIHAMNVVPVW